jgi:hypothetical protein
MPYLLRELPERSPMEPRIDNCPALRKGKWADREAEAIALLLLSTEQ